MADEYTRSDERRFTLRMDRQLFEQLEALAKKDKRAVGREIEYIVERYIEDQKDK